MKQLQLLSFGAVLKYFAKHRELICFPNKGFFNFLCKGSFPPSEVPTVSTIDVSRIGAEVFHNIN